MKNSLFRNKRERKVQINYLFIFSLKIKEKVSVGTLILCPPYGSNINFCNNFSKKPKVFQKNAVINIKITNFLEGLWQFKAHSI